MSLEFENYPLKELKEGTSVFSGFAFKSSDFTTEGIPVIKIKNIQNQHVNLIEDNEYFPFNKLNSKHDKFILKNNDVLIAMTGQGSLGRVGRIKLNEDELMLVNQRVGKFITDEKNFHLNYLYHVLSSKTYEKILFDRGTGSGQPNLSPEIILGTEVPCPDLKIQKRIAYILDQIDELILLNKEINHNLTNLSASIFNNYMENNDKFLELKEICKFIKGKKPKEISELPKNNFLDYLTIEVLSNQNQMYAFDEKGVLANEYDILMVMDGASSGKIFFGKKGLVGSTLAKLNVEDKYLEIVYQFLKLSEKFISDNTTGSAIPHTDKGLVLNLKCPVSEELLKFSDNFAKIRSLIIANNQEIIKLQKLRDTLLPKLMNGEIDVSEVNCD